MKSQISRYQWLKSIWVNPTTENLPEIIFSLQKLSLPSTISLSHATSFCVSRNLLLLLVIQIFNVHTNSLLSCPNSQCLLSRHLHVQTIFSNFFPPHFNAHFISLSLILKNIKQDQNHKSTIQPIKTQVANSIFSSQFTNPHLEKIYGFVSNPVIVMAELVFSYLSFTNYFLKSRITLVSCLLNFGYYEMFVLEFISEFSKGFFVIVTFLGFYFWIWEIFNLVVLNKFFSCLIFLGWQKDLPRN